MGTLSRLQRRLAFLALTALVVAGCQTQSDLNEMPSAGELEESVGTTAVDSPATTSRASENPTSTSAITVTPTTKTSNTVASTTTTASKKVPPTTTDPAKKILLTSFDWLDTGTAVQTLQKTIRSPRTGIYDSETRRLHLTALEKRGYRSWHVPTLMNPTITLDCNKFDNPKIGEYAWVRPNFGGSWNWDGGIGFDKISMDYGDGGTYDATDSDTAAEKAFWHKYTSPGTYTVTATIFDKAGHSASDSCRWTWNCYEDRVTCRTPQEQAESLSGGLGGGGSSSGWFGCYFEGKPIWGSVYVTDWEYLADFTVYITDWEYLADISVYLNDWEYLADSCGEWYVTDWEYLADFTVYITDWEYLADFSIYFTDWEYLAGR